MQIVLLILIIVIFIALTSYFFIKYIDFRKFLCGAFFVSGGIQIYLAFAKVYVPLIGTNIVQEPEIGYTRGILHLILCIVCFLFWFYSD